MAILQVKDLTKTYGKDNTTVTALGSVSFSVDKGEFVAIVGASGSGKSTLMHLIGGVDRPTSGSVTVDGDKLRIILETIGLTDRAKHLPNELSGGQQQRVAVGRALINDPALILADEPTGNLDSKSSGEIIELFKLSNKQYNQTLIVITHDEKIALQADRVITISDGKIISDEVVRQ